MAILNICLMLLLLSTSGLCFNVETHDYAAYRGGVDSMFGYSVAEYRDSNQRGWIIVGAPLNDTFMPGIVRGGSVARCDIAEDNRCFPIQFDKVGVRFVKSPKSPKGIEPIDDKSYQWFGATVSTSMRDGGPVLACAPRYNWFGYLKSDASVAGLKDPVGSCWISHLGNNSANEFSPCRNNDTAGHNRQGMCQAGSSAALSKDGQRVFIGAPGSWYWQGQLFTMKSDTTFPYIPEKTSHSNRKTTHHNLHYTKEGPAYEDNNYLGYSLTVGNFLGNGDAGVAVGVPRGKDLYGNVMFFSSQLQNHHNISGEQMGAYFGYALASGDVDGDGLDDLIVTAPFFTVPENAGVKIETGRIYVFYQESDQKYQNYDSRDGDSNRGQFGLSVTSLGDIDMDGYADFAVGEPYGGPENRGAVYIYHGAKDGVEEKPSQVIYSEQLESPVSTFGWSLSGGQDLDGNHYPDLVVGAYESNSAFYLRARPVIQMYSEINFKSSFINLKNRSCVLSDGTAVACAEIKACCRYVGQGVWPQHTFNMKIVLDEKKRKNPRLFFLDFENRNSLNYTIPLSKDQEYCRHAKVYVAQNLRDKLTTLDAEMSLELLSSNTKTNRFRDPKKRLEPVLAPKNTKKRDSLSIQKHCGSDNVCVPDLSLEVTKNVGQYLLGSNEKLELNVRIQNNAEDAFESMFYLQLPPGIEYINIESQDAAQDIVIQCNAPKISNNNTLRCDIGNPLSQGKLVQFKIYLEPLTFHGMKPSYDLLMKVNSTNPEESYSTGNNQYNLALPIWVETKMEVEGDSRPREVYFNPFNFTDDDASRDMTESEFGPLITHNYTIRNNGPLSLLNVSATLIWPAETYTRDVLMYLLEQPDVSDGAKVHCDSANANYLSLKLEQRKGFRSLIQNTVSKSSNQLNYSGQEYYRPNSLTNEPPPPLDPRPDFDSETGGYLRHRSKDQQYHLRQSENRRYTNTRGTWTEDKQRYRRSGEYRYEDRGRQMMAQLPASKEFHCNTAKCVTLQCYVAPLEKDEEVWIAARYRVNAKTLKKVANEENVQVSTKLIAQVTEQPFIGEPTERLIKSEEIETLVQSMSVPVGLDVVPLWIVVLSASAGTAILLLLVYLLYRCGFFIRNRPMHTPERQPLNSRGRDY